MQVIVSNDTAHGQSLRGLLSIQGKGIIRTLGEVNHPQVEKVEICLTSAAIDPPYAWELTVKVYYIVQGQSRVLNFESLTKALRGLYHEGRPVPFDMARGFARGKR